MDFPSLVRDVPAGLWSVGLGSFPGAYIYEFWLDWGRKDDLLYLFILLPPIAGTFVLFLRTENNVFANRNPSRVAEYRQSNDFAAIHR